MATSSNSQVPAFPFALIDGGPNGETVDIPSDTTHTRSRTTPDHALQTMDVDVPPGLAGDSRVSNVRQHQNMFTVRQEIAAIEQRLLMLQRMEQQNTLNLTSTAQQQQQNNLAQQQQQNNFVQVNMTDPQTSEVARHALEVQQQALQHANQMQASAQAAHEHATVVSQQAQAHTEHIATLAHQEVQQNRHEAQRHITHVESTAQRMLDEQTAALQERANHLVNESRLAHAQELERQKQELAAQARQAVEAARLEAAEEAKKRKEVEEELRQLRSASSQPPLQLFTPTTRQPAFSSPLQASIPLETHQATFAPPYVPVFPTLEHAQAPLPPPGTPEASYFNVLEGLLNSVHQIQNKMREWENSEPPASLTSAHSRPSTGKRRDHDPPDSDPSESSSDSDSDSNSSHSSHSNSSGSKSSSSSSNADQHRHRKKRGKGRKKDSDKDDDSSSRGRSRKRSRKSKSLPSVVCDNCSKAHTTKTCPGTLYFLPGETEDDIVRVKAMELFKVQRLPRDAGDFRAWRNSLSTSLSSFDRTSREVLTRWIAPSFELKPTEHDRKKLNHSEGFVRLDKHLAAALSEEKHLIGPLGVRIQNYLEKCQKHHVGAKGRIILHMIMSEYHLDRQRGAAMTQMHLLRISLEGYKMKDLQNFVQNIDKCLNALRKRDRPSDTTMFEWLLDRLRNVQRLHRTIERIKDSPARSHRRTFRYLCRKLNESIRDSREEENNTALQRNLGQNPKAGGAPGNAKPEGKGKGRDGSRKPNPKKGDGKGDKPSKPRDSSTRPKGDKKGKGKGDGNKADKDKDSKTKDNPRSDSKKPKGKGKSDRPPLTDEK